MSVDVPVSPGWDDLLNHLERDLAAAERLVAEGGAGPLDGAAEHPTAGAWEPPPAPGPVPDHLVPRARELARRQQDLRPRLVASLARLDRVQRLADDSDGDLRPRFVDVVG